MTGSRTLRWCLGIAAGAIFVGAWSVAAFFLGAVAPLVFADAAFDELQGRRRGFQKRIDDRLFETLALIGCLNSALLGWIFRNMLHEADLGSGLSLGSIACFFLVKKVADQRDFG